VRGLLLGLLCAAGATPALAGAAGWRVLVRGADVTRTADPVESRGVLLVDLLGLAPALRLQIDRGRDGLVVRDPSGRVWRALPSGSSLEAADRRLELDPVRLDGASWHVPAAAAAELAGLDLELDPAGRVAVYAETRPPAPARPAGETTAGGWELFSVEKPAEERSAAAAARARPAEPPVFLPPEHESLRLGLGVGWVQGADWATELLGSGSFRGVDTQLSSLVTSGPDGLDFYSGYLSLVDPDRGWAAEAGDLSSEIWGFARGARFSWRQSERHRPGMSLYLDSSRTGNEKTVLALRDEIPVGRRAAVGGEIASDSSWLLRSRWRGEKLALYGYYRDGAIDDRLDGWGTSASLDLWRGLALQGSYSISGEKGDELEWRTVSLRVPLRRDYDVTLERTESDAASARNEIDALTFAFPLGPVRLRARYQLRATDRTSPTADRRPLRSEQEELLTSASFAVRSRLRLELQMSNLWPEQGSTVRREYLVASYHLGQRTRLQAIGTFTGAMTADDVRFQLNHELRDDLSLVAEYGRLSPFQAQSFVGEQSFGDEERFKVMLRKTWDVATPGRGGQIEGLVLDPAGRPIPQITVRLGPWHTVSDAAGRYTFRNLPAGSYELRVEEADLPASYNTAEARRTLAVGGLSSESVNLRLLDLGSVRGRVCIDRDRDGRCAPGEAAEGIVLLLGEHATASGANGSFAFFNLAPGVYRLRIASERLPKELTLAVPSEMRVGLPPGGSLTGLELRLVPASRPIVFQELP
jgi:hypothetical protein